MSDSEVKEHDNDIQDKDTDMESLLLREAKLQARLQAIENDIRGGLNRDSEEQAVQLENREVLEEIERVTAAELEKVRLGIAEHKARQSSQA